MPNTGKPSLDVSQFEFNACNFGMRPSTLRSDAMQKTFRIVRSDAISLHGWRWSTLAPHGQGHACTQVSAV